MIGEQGPPGLCRGTHPTEALSKLQVCLSPGMNRESGVLGLWGPGLRVQEPVTLDKSLKRWVSWFCILKLGQNLLPHRAAVGPNVEVGTR